MNGGLHGFCLPREAAFYVRSGWYLLLPWGGSIFYARLAYSRCRDGISDGLPSFSAGMKFNGLSARDHIKTENALGCDLSNFPTAARDCSAMFFGQICCQWAGDLLVLSL